MKGTDEQAIEWNGTEYKNYYIDGKGRDDVGKFKVNGMVSSNHVKFNKDYKHKLSVIYEGQFNPAGQITGQRTIPASG